MHIPARYRRKWSKLLDTVYRLASFPPLSIFIAVVSATFFGWYAAQISLFTALFYGIIVAAVISSTIMLLIRAKAREFYKQKEHAIKVAQDELLSLASHQLRTPATGVKQYVGMVLQGFAGKVPPAQRTLLEKAYASNDRQLRIINEILHMAKIGSGRIVLAKKPIVLCDLVSDVINEQRGDIDSAGHKLDVSMPEEPITLPADTHMLRMAIENLLSNAIKYTPRGGKITVRVYQESGEGRVAISDTGIGIPQKETGNIFRQFVRLDNETSQQVGGTGIGLYLAKSLVELHGGSVSVQSKQGQGSTFTINLPMKNVTAKGDN